MFFSFAPKTLAASEFKNALNTETSTHSWSGTAGSYVLDKGEAEADTFQAGLAGVLEHLAAIDLETPAEAEALS
jgi:hypothetical protein